MGRFVNPDNTAFKEAVNSKIYVDKSGLIEFVNSVVCTEQKYICQSRPRRFGKSMTANMLTAYYSKGADSKELFSALEISSSPDWEKYLNKYDVIRLDIQGCLGYVERSEELIPFITENVVAELKEIYPEYVRGDEKSLAFLLSGINAKTGKKFVVIIDEWDVLIRDSANNKTVQDEYIKFLRAMFKSLDASSYIALAYMTGILPIKRQKTQSALNNFDEYTILDAGPFAKYVGFTAEEVRMLSWKHGINFEEVRRWYDGYLLDDYHIYNPKAVVNVILSGKFKSYWSDTASYEVIVPLINMNYKGLKEAVIEMLSGGSVPVNTGNFQNDTVSFSSKDDVLTYLIHLGYLAYNERKKTVFIPNEEIRDVMENAVSKKCWSESIAFMERSQRILDATFAMDGKAVAEGIEKIHDTYSSALKYNDENSLASVLTLAYLGSIDTYFKPIRELPAGKGFADFVYLPKPEYRENNPALVVELKWDKDTESAIDQIKKKKYPESVLEYTDNILLVGINYDKTTKRHECVIEKG